MKKIITVNYNSVIPDLSEHFTILPHERLPEMDALIVWNDVIGDCKSVTDFARRQGVPVFVAQHGWYSYPECEYTERKKSPTPGAKHILWSESARNLFIGAGVAAEDTAVVGCPLYSLRVPKKASGPVVLYAPTHADDKIDAHHNMETANTIWATLTGMDGIKPFMKLCASEHIPAKSDQRILFTDRTDPNHVRQTFKLLSQVSAVVVHDEGTFALLSYVMDIPVIKVKSSYPRLTEGCEEVPFDGIDAAVRDALANPSRLSQSRKRVVEEAGGTLEDAGNVTARFADVVRGVIG